MSHKIYQTKIQRDLFVVSNSNAIRDRMNSIRILKDNEISLNFSLIYFMRVFENRVLRKVFGPKRD